MLRISRGSEGSVTIAERLHKRLLALGLDVYKPERIWIGSPRSIDRWRWRAGERISKGGKAAEHTASRDAAYKQESAAADQKTRELYAGIRYEPRKIADTLIRAAAAIRATKEEEGDG